MYNVTLGDGLDQHEEYVLLHHNGHATTLRIHDYQTLYSYPGLYEHIVVHLLKETSHDMIAALLIQELDRTGFLRSDLRVLDFAAGVGLIGEGLHKHGVTSIIGVDILKEAKEAAERDRPGVYTRYFVDDFCQPLHTQELERFKLNCLVCVSALAYHIPIPAFISAYNMIAEGGWIALNFKAHHQNGVIGLLHQIIENGIFEILTQQEYHHRTTVDGKPLTYIGLIGQKRANIVSY